MGTNGKGVNDKMMPKESKLRKIKINKYKLLIAESHASHILIMAVWQECFRKSEEDRHRDRWVILY